MKNLKSLLLVFSLAGLASCSASLEGGSGDGLPDFSAKPEVFEHLIEGPSLEGHRKSGCVRNKWDEGYITYDMTIAGQNMTRTENTYTDSSCTMMKASTTRVGFYRYKTRYAGLIYEVDYKLAAGAGYYFVGENVELDGTALWISDRYVGELVVPDIKLELVGN